MIFENNFFTFGTAKQRTNEKYNHYFTDYY